MTKAIVWLPFYVQADAEMDSSFVWKAISNLEESKMYLASDDDFSLPEVKYADGYRRTVDWSLVL